MTPTMRLKTCHKQSLSWSSYIRLYRRTDHLFTGNHANSYLSNNYKNAQMKQILILHRLFMIILLLFVELHVKTHTHTHIKSKMPRYINKHMLKITSFSLLNSLSNWTLPLAILTSSAEDAMMIINHSWCWSLIGWEVRGVFNLRQLHKATERGLGIVQQNWRTIVLHHL